MEVSGTTDVGVCDRGAVYYPAGACECMLPRGRGGFAALAIQSILQNGMQGLVGIAVDVKCTLAGRIEALGSECFGKPQDAHASSISLLWMSPLAHDHLDKGLDVGPDPGRLCADAFWCPVGTEAVVCWHVITDGGMLPVARRPLMRRNTLTFMINFDRARCDPGPKLLAHKLMGH